ncbi:hypothetical protein GOBAR_DD19485 [Gossypium barbadense]|nr:hypothetical protein GOBAR_DD19485 [Gossypium barbadense]
MGGSRGLSANPSDYKLLEEIGYGASATVYRAIYLPFNDVVAIKCLDLDRCNSNLNFCYTMDQHTSSMYLRGTADIWSFGITALELAHGHAPFSKYPPMKVLLMTIQNAPPGLDYDRDKKFSKSFKEMVAMCLVKDQTKRPTAEKLLKHSFFKHAKPPELSLKKLFSDLPPLWNRVKALQVADLTATAHMQLLGLDCIEYGFGAYRVDVTLKDAAQLALKKMPSAEQEALSQSEYQRGVSAWNFDLDDLKAQASLVCDDDDIHECKDDDESMKSSLGHKATAYCDPSLGKLSLNREVSQAECRGPGSIELLQIDCLNGKGKNLECDIVEAGCQEILGLKKNGSIIDVMGSTSEKDVVLTRANTVKPRETQTGPLTPGVVLSRSSSDWVHNSERFENESLLANERVRQVRKAPSFSGPLMLPNRASGNSLSAPIKPSGGFRDCLDEKSKASLVQIKGRFSVTSENLDLVKPYLPANGSFPAINHAPKDLTNGSVSTSILTTHLQNLFQRTSLQQDLIVNLLNSLQPAEVVDASQNGKLPVLPRSESNGNVELETAASERERLLLGKILELQSRMMNLRDELNAEKWRYEELQQELRLMAGAEENGDDAA